MRLAAIERSRLAELEYIVERGVATFIEVGKALEEIRSGRFYRETHKTFEAYCREKWGWSSRNVNRQIEAATVAMEMGPMGPISERAIRPLKALPTSQRKGAWERAVAKTDGKPTAKAVEAEVQAIRLPGQGFSEEMQLVREAAALIRRAASILSRCAAEYGIGERGAAEVGEAVAELQSAMEGR